MYPNDQGNPAGAIPVYGAGGAVPANDGTVIYPDAWPRTFSYSVDSTLDYSEVTNPTTSAVYRQTFTYTSKVLTAQTAWELQS